MMKYILGIWIMICLIPVVFFLFQDRSTKGVSVTDLKHTFLIFIGGLLLIFLIRKLIRSFKKE